ncbi:DNA polymerase delta subunit 2 [Aphelenchoides bicaudatus]|nr:DNA polymerase delta subunit 2 [Aphelenchoides bicaudatus]
MSSNKENNRVTPRYKNTSDRFLISINELTKTDICDRQFNVLYERRLDQLTSRLLEQAANVLGKKCEIESLGKLQPGKKTLIGGIIHKKSKMRPSILNEFELPNFRREVEHDVEVEEKDVLTIYDSVCSPEDTIELEYGPQRIPLIGNIDKNDFTTGYVLAVYGAPDAAGNFVIEKIIFPKLVDQIPRSIPNEDLYVAFLSGLDIDSDVSFNQETCLALSQFVDWIHGGGASDEDAEISRRVARIVIAGDSVLIRERNLYDMMLTKLGIKKPVYDPTAVEQLDRVLDYFVNTVPVDLMSGATDICDPMFPQQPIVVRAFDKCYRHGADMFQTVTNPYSFEIEDTKLLGTSGQNLNDSLKYTRGHSRMECMKQFLERSYLVPTSPDTIDGYPVRGEDPFIINDVPHVLFAGNQTDHETQMCELENGARTLLMTIPKFSVKHEVVLLNLRTLKTDVLCFDTAL